MPQPDKTAAWIDAENARADDQSKTGTTTNSNAPQLGRIKPGEPDRKQKAFYLQEKHADAWNQFALKMKKEGRKAPELIEEAIEEIIKKYGGEI